MKSLFIVLGSNTVIIGLMLIIITLLSTCKYSLSHNLKTLCEKHSLALFILIIPTGGIVIGAGIMIIQIPLGNYDFALINNLNLSDNIVTDILLFIYGCISAVVGWVMMFNMHFTPSRSGFRVIADLDKLLNRFTLPCRIILTILLLFIGCVIMVSGVLEIGVELGYWEFVRVH